MDNQTVQKLKEAIAKSKHIGIAVGRNPSVDQMAAALSLYLLLQEANKQAVVACPSDPIVELSSLVGINRVQRQLGGEAGDLVVSFPYAEGEIEKVSYTLENGFLNIIVKAAEQGLSFDENDVRYTRGSGAVDLLFVIGTQNLSDLEDVFDSQKSQDTSIINIDNDERNQKFGDIVLVSPRFSSVSEQIADIALSLGFNIERDAAQNLMSGITTATKNFQDPRTTSLAFEVAAYLMKKGANRGREVGGRSEEGPRDAVRPQDRVQDRPQPQGQNRPQIQNRQQPQGGQPQGGQPQGQNRPQMQNRQQPQGNQPQGGQPQGQNRPQAQDRQRLDSRKPGDDRQEQLRQQLRDQEEQRAQPKNKPQPSVQQQDDMQATDGDDTPPVDWLAPKVYKGSSNF